MRIGYVVGALRGFSLSPIRATYQVLNGQSTLEQAHPEDDSEEEDTEQSRSGSSRKLWGPAYQRSTYYWISLLCNCFLVLFSYAGWDISKERDSTHEMKNTARFIIAGVYSFPSMATTGLLLFWHYYRRKGPSKMLSGIHAKLSLFSATNNALTVIFMIIFTLIFDDPKYRFGTGNDVRNTLLPLIIVLAAVSFFAVMTAAWISYSASESRPLNGRGALAVDIEGVVLPPMISPWVLGAPVESSSPIEPVVYPPAKLPSS